jgi:hypothetical protein
MRTRALCWSTTALALGLWAGCASDLWYKQGAGTAALAQDKAACRAEVAQLSAPKASEAFEQCMSARDWFHVTRGRSATPAPAARTLTRPRTAEAAPALAASQTLTTSTPPPSARPAADALVASPVPTPDSDTTPDTTSVDAGPDPVALDAGTTLDEEIEAEIEETALAPEPIDPRARQFWIKLGAGPGQLEADQKTCRREIGLAPTETQPSRWGQSEAFDTCMRTRGWGGGSVSAVPNR